MKALRGYMYVAEGTPRITLSPCTAVERLSHLLTVSSTNWPEINLIAEAVEEIVGEENEGEDL